jgi:Na+(H+)/acetate symporter ActP
LALLQPCATQYRSRGLGEAYVSAIFTRAACCKAACGGRKIGRCLLPISAGIWGIPLGFVVIIVVSLLTPPPDKETQALVDNVRYPYLRGARGNHPA